MITKLIFNKELCMKGKMDVNMEEKGMEEKGKKGISNSEMELDSTLAPYVGSTLSKNLSKIICNHLKLLPYLDEINNRCITCNFDYKDEQNITEMCDCGFKYCKEHSRLCLGRCCRCGDKYCEMCDASFGDFRLKRKMYTSAIPNFSPNPRSTFPSGENVCVKCLQDREIVWVDDFYTFIYSKNENTFTFTL